MGLSNLSPPDGDPLKSWILDGEDAPLIALDPRWAKRRSLAAVVRSLNALVTRADIDLETLTSLEKCISAQLAVLSDKPLIYDRIEYMVRAGIDGPRNRLVRELSAVCGRSNPSSRPLTLAYDEAGRLTGTFIAPITDEGPPGFMHGGLVAAMFDDFLGLAQGLLPGDPAMTGTLSVRYLTPTPLERLLTLRLTSVTTEGRKRFASAELWSEAERTATCDAIFVAAKTDEIQKTQI